MDIRITESRQAQKDLARVPHSVVRAYEMWARIVESDGQGVLRRFPGYHDEALQGKWKGYRSSRLNRKWRVVYRMSAKEASVLEVTRVSAHDYRRRE